MSLFKKFMRLMLTLTEYVCAWVLIWDDDTKASHI